MTISTNTTFLAFLERREAWLLEQYHLTVDFDEERRLLDQLAEIQTLILQEKRRRAR